MRYRIPDVWQRTGLVMTAFILLSVHGSAIFNSSAIDKSSGNSATAAFPASQVKAKDVDPATRASIEGSYGKLPLSFEANNGQVNEAVRFLSRGSGYTLFLTSTEAVVSLRHISLKGKEQIARRNREAEKPKQVASDVIRLKLIKANPNAKITGLDELPGKSNYFIGNDPAKWRADVSNYAKVKMEDVYPGIDLVYYGNQRQLEYDWIVKPGADPKAIRFAVEGKADLKVDARGDLILDKKGELRLNKPLIYQQHAGSRTEIAGKYTLLSKHEAGFQLDKYDASLPLVIDPILSYSTYFGGSNSERGRGIAVDSSGNAYVTGWTLSTNFPTVNPLQASYGGGLDDVFIAKLNALGSGLVYSTYLGGSDYDEGLAIAVDSSGNAYVTGHTNSTNFPTVNPFQANHGGGNEDAFVTKLNASGSALLYSTYLGGSAGEEGVGIAVDSSGNAYVTGGTFSTNFPTANPLQASNAGGFDVFVTKLNASGNKLPYSTYLGGSSHEEGSGIAVDSSGNAYVAGVTFSNDFPTANAVQSIYGGSVDAFVTKLNASGSALLYSTYLGGSGRDEGHKIAVDSSGNAYVTGDTGSTNFPTANAVQAIYGGGTDDGFVTKLNASGNGLVYSTYLGGSGNENFYPIAVDSSGNAYVTGSTDSTNFPLANAWQSIYGGSIDAFVTKLNASGSALLYSTYLGGSGRDDGMGIVVDSSDNAYVTGYTNSTNFPTANPLQASNGGGTDAFVAKISFSKTSSDFDGDGKPDILWRNASTGENYVWYLDGVAVLGGGNLPTVADQNWNIVGVADFNNDGKPDVLWRNTSTGENYVWYVDGVTVRGGGALPPVADQSWKVAGVGDFNNDRKPDVLWRNATTGDNYVWYLDGTTVLGGGNLPTVADQNWKVVGVADFNNDDKPDILWRNAATGDNYVWYLDGVTVLSGGSMPTVADQNWKVAGVADFNSDGKVDILWRNTSMGDNYVWYLDGVTVLGGGNLPMVADQYWTIVP